MNTTIHSLLSLMQSYFMSRHVGHMPALNYGLEYLGFGKVTVFKYVYKISEPTRNGY